MSSLAKSKCSSLRNELPWWPAHRYRRLRIASIGAERVIATSRYYSMEKVMPLLAPLLLLNLGLVVLGTWLVFRSIRRIRHFDTASRAQRQISSLAEFIE